MRKNTAAAMRSDMLHVPFCVFNSVLLLPPVMAGSIAHTYTALIRTTNALHTVCRSFRSRWLSPKTSPVSTSRNCLQAMPWPSLAIMALGLEALARAQQADSLSEHHSLHGLAGATDTDGRDTKCMATVKTQLAAGSRSGCYRNHVTWLLPATDN